MPCLTSYGGGGEPEATAALPPRRRQAALYGGTPRVRVIGLGADVRADGMDGSRSGRAPATVQKAASRSRQRLSARAAALIASRASKYKSFDAKEVEAQAAELQTMTEMSNAVQGSDSERSEANADAQL